MKVNPLSALISSLLFVPQVFANTPNQSSDAIDVITISAPRIVNDNSFADGNYIEPDVADWLNTIPGASVNKNGPITGIAQYRGMFGNRVAKNIGGHPIVSAGPNAMDAPLT